MGATSGKSFWRMTQLIHCNENKYFRLLDKRSTVTLRSYVQRRGRQWNRMLCSMLQWMKSCFWRAFFKFLLLIGLPILSLMVRNLSLTLALCPMLALHGGIETSSSMCCLWPVPFKEKLSIIPRIQTQQGRRMCIQIDKKSTLASLHPMCGHLARHHSQKPIERYYRSKLPLSTYELCTPVKGIENLSTNSC